MKETKKKQNKNNNNNKIINTKRNMRRIWFHETNRRVKMRDEIEFKCETLDEHWLM